jgi:hypothetical protein
MNFEELTKQYFDNIDEILNEEWAVGFKDRGLGHGDFGVVTLVKNTLVVETSGREIAEHISKLHNEFLEKNDNKRSN